MPTLSGEKLTKKLNIIRSLNIMMLSVYKGYDKKHDFICLDLDCKHVWVARFSNIITARKGCPKCIKRPSKEFIAAKMAILEANSIEAKGGYTSAHTRTEFKCIKTNCGYVWTTTWASVTNLKTGCPVCKGYLLTNDAIKTKILNMKSRFIEPLNLYKSTDHKTEFRCLKSHCNHVWKSTWHNVSDNATSCPKCSGNFIDEDTKQARLERLKSRNILLLSKYDFSTDRYDFKCLQTNCGYIWNTNLSSVINRKSGCPKCAGNVLAEDTIADRILVLKSRNIEPIEVYKSLHHKTTFRCLLPSCNHLWKTSWSCVFHNDTGCPRCAGQALTKEEKVLVILRNSIRSKLKDMLKYKKVYTKLYKDDDYMTMVINFFKTQIDDFPEKPNDDQIWHLDHIIPVSKFNPLDIEQTKLCWDARNLQWLTAKVNISKSAKLLEEYFTDWHYQVLDKLGLNV